MYRAFQGADAPVVELVCGEPAESVETPARDQPVLLPALQLAKFTP